MFLVLILEFSFIFKYQNNAKNILDDLLSAYKNIYFKYRQTYVHTCRIYYMLYVYSRNVNECVLTYIFRKYFFTQKFVSCEQLSFKWDTQKTNARSFSRPHIITIWMKFDSKNFGTLTTTLSVCVPSKLILRFSIRNFVVVEVCEHYFFSLVPYQTNSKVLSTGRDSHENTISRFVGMSSFFSAPSVKP